MRRSSFLALSSVALLACATGVARSEEPKPAAPAAKKKAAPPPPTPATDEQAAAAIATFKEEFRAKGLTGEDKLAQRDFALSKLAKVHHSSVVAELGAVARGSDAILRTLAVIYLGDMTLYPGLAGPHVVAAMKKAPDDRVLLISAVQAIGRVRYLGAREQLKTSLSHQEWGLKKAAITAVGDTGDLRLLGELLGVVGIDPTKPQEAGGKVEQGSDGYSWDGVSVNVDTGTAGDGDQREAERQGREQMAANERAAHAAGGGGEGGGGGGGGGGGQSRSPQELLPFIVASLEKMTGEKFKNPKALMKWLGEHQAEVEARKVSLDAAEKEQRARK